MTNRSGRLIRALALTVMASAVAGAHAADQNVTNEVIMGTGISNGGFTVGTGGGVELGLRGRERHDLILNQASNVTGSNNNGTYNQNAGEPPGFGGVGQNRARWNFDWSINSGAVSVNAFTYKLGMDFNAGVGTNFQVFDPIAVPCADHSFGNNVTGPGAGVEVQGNLSDGKNKCSAANFVADSAQYLSLIAGNNLVQNSWNLDFFDGGAFVFDPTVDGTYSFFLEAYDGNARIARTDIDVIVGRGAQVPEPGSLMLLGLGLAGIAGLRRRKS